MRIDTMSVSDASNHMRLAGARLQDAINLLSYAHDETVNERMVSLMAEELNKRYPQYAGHYDGWFLVKVTRFVETKLGKAFYVGDVTIAKVNDVPDSVGDLTVFSFRNVCDTALDWGIVSAL